MKAVIYARYSSDNQREESIDGQLRECMEYAKFNGIDVVNSYIDRALSAKTDNRPNFQRMIKDSYKGLFDVVLVWKLDRFARNRYDSAHYKTILKRNGVRVLSAKETISEGAEGQEQIKTPLFTTDQIAFAIYKFRQLDLSMREAKQALIDGFANAIYLYDDHAKLILNYKNDTKTITLDELQGSDFNSVTAPKKHLFQVLFLVFYGSMRNFSYSLLRNCILVCTHNLA